MLGKDRAVLKKVTVNVPFGIGSAEWESDSVERETAWSLYVELVTRVAVQPLEIGQGSARESLNSLYQLFPTTREILKAAGPGVGASRSSVGGIAIAVLNNGLRPFLSKWHSRLKDWEAQPHVGENSQEHERAWTQAASLYAELEALRLNLAQYAEALLKIADAK